MIGTESTVEQNQHYVLDSEYGVLKGTLTNRGSLIEVYAYRGADGYTVAVALDANDSFMIALPAGTYSLYTHTGATLRDSIRIEKGRIIDLGSFSDESVPIA